MVDRFGQVMVYVNNPKAVADFWVKSIGFIMGEIQKNGEQFLSVEVLPHADSPASLVLFDRNVVAKMEPQMNLGTPSILFQSRDINKMRQALVEKGIKVGEIMSMGGFNSFNFPDPEGNYFAVKEIDKE